MTALTPPIKCQGIKTKLVPWIRSVAVWNQQGVWIEPFVGSGVVGMNLAPQRALFADTNPHIIALLQALQNLEVTPSLIRSFLEKEGAQLLRDGEDHYYRIRERFNQNGDPLDFLFLNRACFNGVMRFNKKGKFNVPFCRKPNRFAKAYITKIVNQAADLVDRMRHSEWKFQVQSFEQTILSAQKGDFIYADPPYVGRHVDYFDSWDEEKERKLFSLLHQTPAQFILSTWEENIYRRNPFVDDLWGDFPRITQNHFYHVGASEQNRHAMTEALVLNFEPAVQSASRQREQQMALPLSSEDELQSGILTVKDFSTGVQTKVPRAELAAFLAR